MKRIEKVLSRDMTLIDMHAWSQSLTKGLKKWLGWSYSDVLFYFHDEYSDVILLTEEHYGKFLNFVLKKIKKNPAWFQSEHKKFLVLTKEFFIFFKEAKKKLKNNPSNQELIDIYNTYTDYMNKHFGPFVVMKWLPIWLEDKPALNKLYNKEARLAIAARKQSEKTLPQGRELCSLLMKSFASKLPAINPWINFISYDDYYSFLTSSKKINIQKLQKRKLGYILSKKGVFLTTGKQPKAKQIFNKIGYEHDFENSKNVAEFKGQSAYRGITNGIVRLIMVKEKIIDLKPGEILVTSMTTPEYLLAMKKSSAFITDEGGITCHAAIVAREMKKPCIIGTKNATKILKTGDYVCVDANNGIVRILKRA